MERPTNPSETFKKFDESLNPTPAELRILKHILTPAEYKYLWTKTFYLYAKAKKNLLDNIKCQQEAQD